ncbi:peptidoglycan DD-metalloendopeptidase family protein, partial [Candidatus Dojkabacteria bacterium]|nr:peptidoglycan DD-metalloendopeptidase family protein [Candidatus Dojkabacteria bacterium]
GICQDGNYTVAIKSTDAAGNASGTTKHVVERDTVRPETPNLNVSKSGGIGNEVLGLMISGEKNSTALVTVIEDGRTSKNISVNLGSNGSYSATNLVGFLKCGNVRYTIVVRIEDSAKNISLATSSSIATGECPTCSNGGKLAFPVRPDYIITSGFRTPERPTHEGLDMIRKGGDSYRADIYATGAGQIIRSTHTRGEQWGKPNYVTLKHDDGKVTEYWHLDNESSDNDPIGIGQRTGTMTVLGHMGKTGESTGVHLHFGVYIAGSSVNPEYYIGDKEDPGCAMEISADADKSIQLKESQLGSPNRDGGIHDWCGTKVQDYYSIGNHGDSIIMYNPNDRQAYLITGGIWETYWKNGACSEFGYPKMDEEKSGRLEGWYQFFDKANIYWSKDSVKSQPGIVKGYIRDYYENKGGTWSYLGFPEDKEWNATSTCNTTGTHQNFTSGKIYASQIGQADWEYGGDFLNLQGDTIKHYWDLGEMNGELGWPKSGSYRKSTDNIYLENGEIHQTGIFDTGVNHKIYGGCSDLSQRKNDPDNYTAKLIQAKENTFTSYQRVNGGNGNGAVHQWTCGGNTMWLANYNKVGGHGNSVIIANENLNEAFLLTGEIWNKYRDNNGCSILKKPTADEYDTGIHKTWLWKSGTSLRQTFESGDVYSFGTFNLIGQETRHTHIIYGNVKTKYDANSGMNGSYKFLKSDRYSYNENDVKTFCQDSEGGRICENDIPALTDEQKKLGELLGRFVSKNEIKDQCSLRVVSIDDGIAYYDNGFAGKITGNIYRKWQPGCNTYGKPVSSIQSVNSRGMEGVFQRFQFNNWDRVYDFYDSNFGTIILEGDSRNMYIKYGFDNLGFPKTSALNNAKANCEKGIKAGHYLDVQKGRVYKSDYGTFWVKGGGMNGVEKYFWENGAHEKIGLPKGDEYTSGLLGSTLTQEFELAKIYDPLIGGAKTNPETFYCPGQEPTPTPMPTQTPEPTTTPTPTDPKEAECQAKGLIKYTNPNNANDVVCAKILNVPYINQYLDSSDPKEGEMCAAAAAVMATAYFKKIPIGENSKAIADYMSQNQGQDLYNGKEVDTEVGKLKTCYNGAFGYTGIHVSCNSGSIEGVRAYLKYMGLSYSSPDWLGSLTYLKNAINNENPVIISYVYEPTGFGHVTIVKGYTEDGRFIMADSYRDTFKTPPNGDGKANINGNGAIYDFIKVNAESKKTIGEALYPIKYLLEVKP